MLEPCRTTWKNCGKLFQSLQY